MSDYEVIDGVLWLRTDYVAVIDDWRTGSIHDISALMSYRSLRVARFNPSDTPLDIEPLTTCPHLTHLYLHRPVVSAEPLTRCHKLEVLEIWDEPDGLALPPLVRNLTLVDYNKSLRFLAGHPSLSLLHLQYSNPTDLDILPTIPRLKQVVLLHSPAINPKDVYAYDERWSTG